MNRVLGAHRGADTRARLFGLEGIHQESMVLTQWAFIGPALLWPRELGLNPNDDWGMMGLVEVMAEVGRQLGVREELNMCSGGLKEAREYALLLHRRIQQHLSQPSELADDMSTQLLSGANILNPFIRLISSIQSTNILRFLNIACCPFCKQYPSLYQAYSLPDLGLWVAQPTKY